MDGQMDIRKFSPFYRGAAQKQFTAFAVAASALYFWFVFTCKEFFFFEDLIGENSRRGWCFSSCLGSYGGPWDNGRGVGLLGRE